MAAHGTEKEVLRQVMRPADLIAANEVGVVRLQVRG